MRRSSSLIFKVAETSHLVFWISFFRLCLCAWCKTLCTARQQTYGICTCNSFMKIRLTTLQSPFSSIFVKFRTTEVPQMSLLTVPYEAQHHIVTKAPPIATPTRRLSLEGISSTKTKFNHTLGLKIISRLGILAVPIHVCFPPSIKFSVNCDEDERI